MLATAGTKGALFGAIILVKHKYLVFPVVRNPNVLL